MGLFSERAKDDAKEWQSRSQRRMKKRANFRIESIEPRILLNSAPVAAVVSPSDTNHSSDAIVLTQELTDSIKISFEGWNDQAKDSEPPSSILDLSSAANHGRKISIQVKADWHVEVLGAADGDYVR